MKKELVSFLHSLQLSDGELIVYDALSVKPLIIREIAKKTKLSERSIRTHVQELLTKGFIVKRPVTGKRLMYLYAVAPPETILASIGQKVADLEIRRKKMESDIIEGTDGEMR